MSLDFSTVAVHALHRELGAVVRSDHTTFTVWSPKAKRVAVLGEDKAGGGNTGARIELRPAGDGYWRAETDRLGGGDRYRLVVDDASPVPDPASRFQPDGVHGPSEVVVSRFDWTDDAFRPPPITQWIIYELHIGTFTPGGTYVSATERLDELCDLGVNAIELMPLADCPGRYNWGYDGVNLFAPNRNYGSPDDLRRFVDEAHRRNLAVIHDVVYNHLGPEGNYLPAVGPYLSTKHQTPWGAGPNLDHRRYGHACRRFFLANAIYWLDEFHFDGLRVDAIHCIADESPTHFAADLSAAVEAFDDSANIDVSDDGRRKRYLIAESNVFDRDMCRSRDGESIDGESIDGDSIDGESDEVRSNPGLGFDAQWSDCFVHALYAHLRPDEHLTPRRYDVHDLNTVLHHGYVFTGSVRGYRGRESVVETTDPAKLVRCIQNHDFVGNHPTGRRLTSLVGRERHLAAAATLLLMPSIPMLFMGEEFGCDQPFRFFVDFGDERLRRAVRRGRRREYPQHDWDAGIEATDPAAFRSSVIGPITDRGLWEAYRDLIALRVKLRAIGLLNPDRMAAKVKQHPLEIDIAYNVVDQPIITRVLVCCRFGSGPISIPGKVLFDSRDRGFDASQAAVVVTRTDSPFS